MTKRDPGGRKRSLKLANEIRRQQKDDDNFGPSGGGGGGVGKREAKDTNDDDAGGGRGAKSSFEGLIAPHAMKKATKKAKFLESASLDFRGFDFLSFATRSRLVAFFFSLSLSLSSDFPNELFLSLSLSF